MLQWICNYNYEADMKSVLISFIMFAMVLASIYFGVFEALSSTYFMIFAIFCLIGALIFAVKVLGAPWKKDKNHE